jgi:hypothetical protein
MRRIFSTHHKLSQALAMLWCLCVLSNAAYVGQCTAMTPGRHAGTVAASGQKMPCHCRMCGGMMRNGKCCCCGLTNSSNSTKAEFCATCDWGSPDAVHQTLTSQLALPTTAFVQTSRHEFKNQDFLQPDKSMCSVPNLPHENPPQFSNV